MDWADITAPQMHAVFPCLSPNEFSSAAPLKAHFYVAHLRVSVPTHTLLLQDNSSQNMVTDQPFDYMFKAFIISTNIFL